MSARVPSTPCAAIKSLTDSAVATDPLSTKSLVAAPYHKRIKHQSRTQLFRPGTKPQSNRNCAMPHPPTLSANSSISPKSHPLSTPIQFYNRKLQLPFQPFLSFLPIDLNTLIVQFTLLQRPIDFCSTSQTHVSLAKNEPGILTRPFCHSSSTQSPCLLVALLPLLQPSKLLASIFCSDRAAD